MRNLNLFLTLLFLFLIPLLSFCQNDSEVKLDSIEQAWKALSTDAEIISALQELSLDPKLDVETMEAYTEKALNKISNTPETRHQVLNLRGFFYGMKGKHKESVELLKSLLTEMDTLQDNKTLLSVYRTISDNIRIIGKIDESDYYAKKCYEASKSLDQSEMSFSCMMVIIKNLRHKGFLEEAIDSLKASEKYITDKNTTYEIASYYNTFGLIYRELGNYDLAIKNYNILKEILTKENDKRGLSIIYNNLGNVEQSKGNLEKALEYYITSLEFKKELGNKRSISISYHNIGTIRQDLGLLDLSIRDLKKSLELTRETNFEKMIVLNLCYLGISYNLKKEYDTAIEQLEEGLTKAKEIQYKKGFLECHTNLGFSYFEKNKIEKALFHFIQGNQAAKEIDRKADICSTTIGIAQCYEVIHNSNSTLPENANISASTIENMLLESIEIAKEIKNNKHIRESLAALQRYYQRNNNTRKEAYVSRELLILNDSIFTSQKADAISEWETKYETKEKEQEIILLQKDKEIQTAKSKADRNKLIFIIIGIGLIAIAGLVYFYFNNQLKRSREMALIRTKISSDLHDDVGSVLTGLAMQSEILSATAKAEDKPKLERITEMSRSAMSQMRDAVWAMDARRDNWGSLFDRVNEFAQETLREKDIQFKMIHHSMNQEQELVSDIRQHIYLICKEAITNIIKHSNADQVQIEFRQSNQYIFVDIHDNGKVEKKDFNSSGLGTSNMKMRAERINGHLDITQDDGFKIQLKIPK